MASLFHYPLLPKPLIERLNLSYIARHIHERRGTQHLAQADMQGIQELLILCKLNSARDIFLHRRSRKLPDAGTAQNGQPQPCAIPPPITSDDGHAHIERITGGAAADIGIGIQRDIRTVVYDEKDRYTEGACAA